MKQLTLAAVGFERYADAAGSVSCRDGARCAVVGAVRANRAILSEAGQWPAADRGGADAAHLFLAAVVQSVGPGGGGGALRFVGNAALCRHQPPPSRGQALGREPVPDETTVFRFRHLLEAHDLGQQLFDEVQRHLAAKGLKVATGTIVDATIINAPSSTKNADKARDPEMHQTNKGNQWYFGMKAHFGVDSRTKLIHAVTATPANVADRTILPDLLHGQETRVWGDQAYRGQGAVIRRQAPNARDFTNRRYRHRGVIDEIERSKMRTKPKVRARVEHAIGVIKRVFGFAKVRYRGLKKNPHRLLITCALANLFMVRRHLLRCQGA